MTDHPADPRQGLLTTEDFRAFSINHRPVTVTSAEGITLTACWGCSQTGKPTLEFRPYPCPITRLLADRARLETALAEAREQVDYFIRHSQSLEIDLDDVAHLLAELITGPCVRTDTAGVCWVHGLSDCPHAAAREWLAKQEAKGE